MLIKPEPTSLAEEDIYESPPVLTPHHSDLVAFEDLSEDVDSTVISDIGQHYNFLCLLAIVFFYFLFFFVYIL